MFNYIFFNFLTIYICFKMFMTCMKRHVILQKMKICFMKNYIFLSRGGGGGEGVNKFLHLKKGGGGF